MYLTAYGFGGLAAVAWGDHVVRGIPRPGARTAVLAAVVAAVAAEQTGFASPSRPKADFYPRAERAAAALRGADAGYVVPRPGDLWIHDELVGMWAGLRANVPVVNECSGRLPPGYDLPGPDPDAAVRRWLGGRFRGRVAVVPAGDPAGVRVVGRAVAAGGEPPRTPRAAILNKSGRNPRPPARPPP